MTTITGYAAGTIIMDEISEPQRLFQVRAYDEDGDRITHLNGRLDEQYFANEADVRAKLGPAIAEYNKLALYHVAKLEVFLVSKIAESEVKETTVTATTSEIGEFKRST